MRTDFELWLIVEQNFDEHFTLGLCTYLDTLNNIGKINVLEKSRLITIINKYGISRFGWDKDVFFWIKGHKKPRRMFIQKQILKIIRDGD